jgi:hypothetical protein
MENFRVWLAINTRRSNIHRRCVPEYLDILISESIAQLGRSPLFDCSHISYAVWLQLQMCLISSRES